MPLQPLPYTCRLCFTQHIAYYDDTCPDLHLDRWLKLLCCDRCHDYFVPRNRIAQSVFRVCYSLSLSTHADAGPPPAAVEIARAKLIELTKAYARLVCTHYHVAWAWEPEIADHILRDPSNAAKTLRVYEHAIARSVSKNSAQAGSSQIATV